MTTEPIAPTEPSLVSRRTGVVVGLASALAGLGLAEVIAGFGRSLQSPVLSVGDRVVDLVPAAVKDLAIELFGTNDKIALLVGIAVGLIMFAAGLGIAACRGRRSVAIGGAVLFGLVGSVAALTSRAGAEPIAALPSIAGAGLTALALVALSNPPRTSNPPTVPDHQPSRRHAISMLTSTAAVGVAGIAAGRSLNGRFDVDVSQTGFTLPKPLETLPPIPAAAQAPSAAPFITPNADFYRIDTALSVPQIDTATWTLRVSGMVDTELEISYADLLNRDLIERDITLTCVSNTIGGELMGTARWLGTRLDTLLEEAGIDPAATQIVGRSVDGYTCGFPVSTLDGRDALVAVAMNGEPLPVEHGFPARLIVPGLYGYVSATKWLSEIELTTFDAFDHYWVPRGYSVEAPIKLQSRIDTPRGLDRISPGPFVIGGVAWAQTIGVDDVEISIDQGPWEQATLADEVNDVTWRQWSFPWDATPGRHSVTVRATDRNGVVQTADRTEPLPNGASGHHTVVVLVDEA